MAAIEEPIVVGKRIFVGNLPFATTDEELKETFNGVGGLTSAVVTKVNGRSRGWGLVEFETPELAIQAITTLNETEVGGRRMVVREDRGVPKRENGQRPRRRFNNKNPNQKRTFRPKKEPRPVNSSGLQIVALNIPFSLTNEQFAQHFGNTNGFESAQVVIRKNGQSAGYGTVKFTSTEAALEASKSFHRTDIGGRTARVFIDRYA
uniref:Uncharacterized protein n=1 Tax=Polytomella parva TaxID=51329 RepID=A0A7S0VLB8_9CHLO|mmetsp:Transcript_6623/g.12936  ORF Transcript_6623/g.12936 Transcript_6623/m.12936 type:complete len:206 (+) Transcript_6623:125-742(+)|eukprot:CAMPEP_0175055346 /NCGR_PEP_ID=MMETSP0052_2-20121109/10025_1 /TAXON_ID=51329 ORGANISM="Polytomella parva, Strain SAG 63-3" /NCGR_SAMPLE_ID=MMETSP0052_2 /ASSEMBLY_ACC=CAM_ASM_000194 /LENGTH=205 /DNA_ID=CAMNT_0016320173 /DNA_START=103 /DNA_END=720 /DNA_ORIENTATION=+